MKSFLFITFLCFTNSIFAQNEDEFKFFFFKDLTRQSQEHHILKMKHNLIAGEILLFGSIVSYTQIINRESADQNLKSAIKPITGVAAGIGLLCWYYVGRHSYLYNKNQKIAPSSHGIGLSISF